MATNDPRASRVADPDYEVFWKKVAEACDIVAAEADKEILVAVGNKQASVKRGKKVLLNVLIDDYEAPKPVLIVPPGGKDK